MKTFTFTALFLAALSGCAPGYGNRFVVSEGDLPVVDVRPSSPLAGVRVAIAPPIDGRESDALVVIDGRGVAGESDNDLRLVGNRFEELLRAEGATIRTRGGAELSITLEEWRVVVRPKFPLTYGEGRATIAIELRDDRGRPRFRGRYGGLNEYEHPMMSEAKTRSLLVDALDEALRQAARAPRLRDALREVALTSNDASPGAGLPRWNDAPARERSSPQPSGEREPEVRPAPLAERSLVERDVTRPRFPIFDPSQVNEELDVPASSEDGGTDEVNRY